MGEPIFPAEARDATVRGKKQHAAGVREEIVLSIERETEVCGFGGGFNGFFRAGEKMPAGIRLRAAEMNEGFLFLFRGHVRRFAGIEADENNIIVAAGIEAEHAERADHALLDLIAEHRAAVVDEREDHRLLLAEIVAELHAAAGFVAEREVQGHGTVERWFETDVLQSARHGGS